MIKEQVGLLFLGTITLISACSYMAPSESNSAGSQASSSATSSGEGGIGTSSNNAASSSNGQGGVGGQGGASSSSVGAGGEGAGTTSSSSSSSGGPNVEVYCGGVVCQGTDLCCIKPGNPPFYSCAASGTCENAEIQCDGPEDCSVGFVCCGMVDVNGNYLKLHCAKECLAAESQICNTDKMPTTCPDPLGCSALPTLGAPYGGCE